MWRGRVGCKERFLRFFSHRTVTGLHKMIKIVAPLCIWTPRSEAKTPISIDRHVHIRRGIDEQVSG